MRFFKEKNEYTNKLTVKIENEEDKEIINSLLETVGCLNQAHFRIDYHFLTDTVFELFYNDNMSIVFDNVKQKFIVII